MKKKPSKIWIVGDVNHLGSLRYLVFLFEPDYHNAGWTAKFGASHVCPSALKKFFDLSSLPPTDECWEFDLNKWKVTEKWIPDV